MTPREQISPTRTGRRHTRPSPVPRPRPRVLVPLSARPAPRCTEERSTEALLGEVLSGVLDRDDVPTDADVFDDLGADSLLMAKFCARVRKHPDLPSIAMQDVYAHPTVADLARHLDPPPAEIPADVPVEEDAPGDTVEQAEEDAAPAPPRSGTASYVLCGAAQLLVFLAYSLLVAEFVAWAFVWVSEAEDLAVLYLRALAAGAAGFAGLSLAPIVVKWVLVGRWKPAEFRVWGPAYLRFWVVKTLVRTNPLVLFAGSPLYSLYLRALGARIGRRVVVLGAFPVCTDLFTAGEGAVVRKDAIISCYRAFDGRIQTGTVRLGRDSLVGETTVLDIDTVLGDGATLGHTSALHRGQVVPARVTWHGSPARPTDVDYRTVPPAHCGAVRRIVYPLVVLALTLGVVLPVLAGGAAFLIREVPQLTALLEPGPAAFTDPVFLLDVIGLGAAIYVGATAIGLLFVTTAPRLLALGLRADRVHPLYGVRYWLHQAVLSLTNVTSFTYLFGDSSAIAHYLGRLGYDLRPLVQTGSNFGMAVKQDHPYLTSVGSGTVVADGLSVINADYSATSFRISRTRIGARNFLGNRVAYPPQGRTGDDCLLATKVMVPIEGPVREGVGLLGSPSFEIPRTVARDSALDPTDPEELRRALAGKNRHNGVSMLLHMVVRWLFVLGLQLIVAGVASLPVQLGAVEIVLFEIAILVFTALWFAGVERSLTRLQLRAPDGCSIYDPTFWRHERFWKVPAPDWMQVFNGTPFKNVAWRLLGAHVGARVFDDGANLTEKTFTTIGDDCTLGEGTVVQCHSQEDGAFKSDHVVIGARVTLGVGAFVHYGTWIGDGAELAADTFLMKGEEVPAGERWGGNPARALGGGPDTVLALTKGSA